MWFWEGVSASLSCSFLVGPVGTAARLLVTARVSGLTSTGAAEGEALGGGVFWGRELLLGLAVLEETF